MRHPRTIIRGFIVFEGIDGTGTTTQLGRLADRLTRAGAAYRSDCEPTAGPIGQIVRQALSGAFKARPETVARLFAADRGEHLYAADGIVDSADQGSLVVSDRYLFSSLAYQGLTCGSELPESLNADYPLPELLLHFELDPEEAARRMSGRAVFDIYENLDFQRRVDAAYRSVIASFEGLGMTITRIDASNPPDKVEADVWAAVEPLVVRGSINPLSL